MILERRMAGEAQNLTTQYQRRALADRHRDQRPGITVGDLTQKPEMRDRVHIAESELAPTDMRATYCT